MFNSTTIMVNFLMGLDTFSTSVCSSRFSIIIQRKEKEKYKKL